MSKWSDEQADGAALEFIPGRVDGGEFWPWSIKQRLRELLDGKNEYSVNVAFARGCTRAVGRAILDLRSERDEVRERADKAEQRCAALEAKSIPFDSPGSPEYERIKALQPFPMNEAELKRLYGKSDPVEIMRSLQSLLEPMFPSCPWCGHSGPLFSAGDHNGGCVFLNFLLG